MLLIAAVLLIGVGLYLGGTMASRDARQQQIALTETMQSMNKIAAAIVQFAIAEKRLPCPADPTAAEETKGREVKPCDNLSLRGKGVVPWVTIGLPASSALDSWNSVISYRVPHELTDAGTFASATGFDKLCRSLDAATGDCAASSSVSDIPFVIVSHGPAGHGAWLPSGAQRPHTGLVGENEAHNLGPDGDAEKFYALPETAPPAKPGDTAFFDDIAGTVGSFGHSLPAGANGPLTTPELKALIFPDCPSGATGTYPACACTTGTYNQTSNTCDVCPAGTTGNPPNCIPSVCPPTEATGTPPECICNDATKSYSPGTNTCVATPPNCPPTATGRPPACTCAASGTVYDIGSNACVAQNNCPSGATGTPPACTCTTGLYDASTNTCAMTCPANSTGTVPNCVCNAGFEMIGGTCQTQPVFTAPGGGGTSSFVPPGIPPGSPSTSSYTVATTVDGHPALDLYSPTGEKIGTVTADMGVDNTSVNSALTWNATTGLGVSSSGGGGPGGGPNAAMERSEGVVMNFTSHFRSIALAMFDLQGTASATGTNDVVFVYLFRRPPETMDEENALRQFALPACSGSNNTYALFNSLMAGQGELFDLIKVKVQDDANNNVKNNIYAMSLSGTASATMTITGALSPCTVWYCDTPNTCGPAARPWRVYSAASPG